MNKKTWFFGVGFLLFLVLVSCDETPTSVSETPQQSGYSVNISFLKERVNSIFYNYSNGLQTGRTISWGYVSSESHNLEFFADSTLDIGDFVVTFSEIDDSTAAVEWNPHSINVECTIGDSISVTSEYWYSSSTIAVGTVRERIRAKVLKD